MSQKSGWGTSGSWSGVASSLPQAGTSGESSNPSAQTAPQDSGVQAGRAEDAEMAGLWDEPELPDRSRVTELEEQVRTLQAKLKESGNRWKTLTTEVEVLKRVNADQEETIDVLLEEWVFKSKDHGAYGKGAALKWASEHGYFSIMHNLMEKGAVVEGEGPKAIGIDLGTTNSCVAVWMNDRVEIIPNDQGNRTTPSCVGFNDFWLSGDNAQRQFSYNPTNSIVDIKQMIGRTWEDYDLQHYISQRWPFTVVERENGPVVSVDYKGKRKEFTPEEITSLILLNLKESAQNHIGSVVRNAVITIPSTFTWSQRQATREAAELAGLNVLRLISNSALAIVGDVNNRNGARGSLNNVLVFDLGGGRLEVTLVTIEETIIEVKATAGLPNLGGEDFDDRLVKYCINEFKRQNNGKDLTTSARAIRRLRTGCERAKRNISFGIAFTIEIDSLFEGIDFMVIINRTLFEDLCQDLFRQTLEPVDEVLQLARFSKADVDRIVLVGGSSRIPKIQQLLSQFFDNKTLDRSLHADEAAAAGAAVQAAILTGDTSTKTEDVLLLDAEGLSKGVEVLGGAFEKLLPRNTTLPSKKSETFTTHMDNQPSIQVRIYEGERARTKDNILLGVLELPLSPARKGVPRIDITMDIDANGVIIVSAIEKTSLSPISHKITISKETVKEAPLIPETGFTPAFTTSVPLSSFVPPPVPPRPSQPGPSTSS